MSSPTISTGTVIASRYEIQATLGRGGMGMVFKAHDRVLDETVALKILRPDVTGSGEMERRFRSEIKLARKVRHRNVCGIHEYGEAGGLQYIAMEYIQGDDLKRHIKDTGGLPPTDAFEIALQLAKSLQSIHDVGIVHRDLKTANAMIDKDGLVRLMDFGIAKKVDTEASQGATAVGHIIGTPEYMSPEQARGEKIDFRSDIYALGIVIYEIFTGKVPFQAETPLGTIFKHLQDPPPLSGPPAAKIPGPMIQVLTKALAKDPNDRYPSVRVMIDALRDARTAALPGTGAAQGGVVRPSDDDLDTTSLAARSTISAPPGATIVAPPPSFARPPAATGQRPTPPPRPAPSVSHEAPPTRLSRPMQAPPPSRGRSGMAFWLLLPAGALVVLSAIAIVLVTQFWPSPAPAPTPTASVANPDVTPVDDVATPTPESQATPIAGAEESPSVALPTPPPRQTPIQTPAPEGTPTPRTRATLPLIQVTPTPHVAAPTPPPAKSPGNPANESGVIKIVVRPWAEVVVDGQVIGNTPIRPLTLAAGQHTVRVTNPDYKPLFRKVNLRAGEELKVEIDLTWEGIKIR
jgi:serine/threonine-protein kinase